MNCPKTLTNGRISLTKQLHFTQNSSAPFHITSKTSISPYLCFHLSFHRSKAQKCPNTCFRGPISMAKARERLILCFRLSFRRSKARKCPISFFRLSHWRPKARKHPILCFRRPISMTKAQNQTILCFRNSDRDNYGLLTGNTRSQCIQTDINFLVSTVNLFDIADYAGSFG